MNKSDRTKLSNFKKELQGQREVEGLKTHKFSRKPFYVDAVRVSEANIELVAKWCDGIVKEDDTGHQYLSVKVDRPLNERQTQAYIGDWVLSAGRGYKVYTPKAFEKAFERVKTLTKEQADEAGIKVPHEPRQQSKPVPTPPRHRGQRPKKVVVTQKGSGVTASVPAEEAEGKIKTNSISAGTIHSAPEDADAINLTRNDDLFSNTGKTKADVEAEKLIAEVAQLSEEK